MMLTELCQELRNWFDRDQPKLYGDFEITDGKIITDDFTAVIQNNQYFRIIGSVFNDGVHQYTEALSLTDEVFHGAIWLMAVPHGVIALSDKIDEWNEKHGDIALSPYSSESFGGYSYAKGSNTSWQSIFRSELNRWRKI